MTALPRIGRFPVAALILVLAIAAFLRVPRIGEGMPYFYSEDEAHHFNRTVNMVKRGEWNPNYFHKPSLHFYMRIPVVAASFLWSVRQGYLRSLKEIQTQDRYGLAGYAFTASHPGIVKWNRAFSILLNLLTVVLTYCLVRLLKGSNLAAAFAALLLSVSPAMVSGSAVIGVDMPMTFMCMAAVVCAVITFNNFSLRRLALCGLIAGLAVSTKYNALPIMVVPLLICIFAKHCAPRALILSVLTPLAGFFIGSPFILVSLPLFLDQFAYEIWHYGISGHEGHSAEPGFAQAAFYFSWLKRDVFGAVAFAMALCGIPLLIWRSRVVSLPVAAFPFLFFILMSMQRANFERNMLVLVPFLAVFAGITVDALLLVLEKRKNAAVILGILLTAVVAFGPLAKSLEERGAVLGFEDSRTLALHWLKENHAAVGDVAVAGQLMFPKDLTALKGVSTVSISAGGMQLFELYQQGFDALVSAPLSDLAAFGSVLSPYVHFAGSISRARVLKNPEIQVYRYEPKAFLSGAIGIPVRELSPLVPLKISIPGGPPISCADFAVLQRDPGEEYCWFSRRFMRLKVENLSELSAHVSSDGKLPIRAVIYSPWDLQVIKLSCRQWQHSIEIERSEGKWRDFDFEIPFAEVSKGEELLLEISKIHSPKTQGTGDDERRLGFALSDLKVRT